MTITIYASAVDEVKKRLRTIERKARACGVPFSWSIGKEYTKELKRGEHGPSETITACDVKISDQIIKRDGWKIIARLEHLNDDSTKKNIVLTFDDLRGPAPLAWSEAPCNCDVCRTRRKRNYTFICENANGERVQVGRECLKQYTGIDGGIAAYFAQVIEQITDEYNTENGANMNARGAARVYSVKNVIALAADEIKKHGYTSSRNGENSTRCAVINALRNDKIPSEQSAKTAAAAMEWLVAADFAVLDDYTRNAAAIVQAGYCKAEHVGILAYLPRAWEREEERRKREQERMTAAKKSRHIGTIGERITVKIDSVRLLASYANYINDYRGYMTFVYKITSDNVTLIWKTGSASLDDIERAATITGTIKSHGEYHGERQTIITRCKLNGEREHAPYNDDAEKALAEMLDYLDAN